jgi:uncharacterized protein YndB with AHSA1/START domain
MRRFESFIEVEAPVERVFDLLADFEAYPRWMGGVRDVRRTGRRTTHWVAETALDFDVEWDAETTHFEPDRRIVWRAFRGDVHADGEAVLAETERGTTVVHYVIGYDTPAGRDGAGAAPFFGEHPKRRLERDLGRFKRLVEGEARSRRGDGMGFDERPFRAGRGEGGRARPRDERFDDRLRHFLGGAGRGRYREASGEDLRREDARPRGLTRDYSGDYRDRRGAGRGFDPLARETRREREEGAERHERERAYRERESREEERSRARNAQARREAGAERGRSREEAGRAERESEWFERRGVDRLLEDPPSGHWRR